MSKSTALIAIDYDLGEQPTKIGTSQTFGEVSLLGNSNLGKGQNARPSGVQTLMTSETLKAAMSGQLFTV